LLGDAEKLFNDAAILLSILEYLGQEREPFTGEATRIGTKAVSCPASAVITTLRT
jgi:hypothetical protein